MMNKWVSEFYNFVIIFLFGVEAINNKIKSREWSRLFVFLHQLNLLHHKLINHFLNHINIINLLNKILILRRNRKLLFKFKLNQISIPLQMIFKLQQIIHNRTIHNQTRKLKRLILFQIFFSQNTIFT